MWWREGLNADHPLWPWLTATLLVWLFVFQAARLYTTPLAYDDAYLAAAAKSLAFGHGYATHYPSLRPFDVQLGVGLALQIPAAGLVALFGNRYWVPGLATVFAIDLLILAILFHLRRSLERALLTPVAVTVLVAFALLTADRNGWILSHWYSFLGDIPAALMVILAILFLSRDLEATSEPRMVTGLLMGLAVEMKLVAALGVAPAVLVGVAVGCRSGKRGAVRRALFFAGAVLLPSVLVQFWELWALGGSANYLDHMGAWRSYLASQGSGAGFSGFWTAILSGGALFPRAAGNARVAMEYFGGISSIAAVLVLVSLVAVRFWNQSTSIRPRPGEQRVAGALLWAALVMHAGWWVIFSPMGWINHLLPALLYLGAAFALSLTVPAKRSLVIAMWAAAGIVTIPRLAYLPAYLPSFSQDTQIHAALEVRDLLVSQRAVGAVHLACGWWVPRDLEYLLPGVGNFYDCLQVDPSAFAEGRFVLVRNLGFWNWEQNTRIQEFADSCERTTVFRNAQYVLSRCTSPP